MVGDRMNLSRFTRTQLERTRSVSTWSVVLPKALASVLVLLAAICGCDSRPATQAAFAPAMTVVPPEGSANSPPETKEANRNRFTTTGPLVAEQQADVAAERDGRVASIAVEIGDRVKRGQLLASLDSRVAQAAVTSQTARLASLHAQVREWESEEKMDGADLRRADQMRAEKILSEEGWEHVKYKLDEVTAEVARYRADVTAAEADISAAKLQLEQCRILAPFAGVVGRQTLRAAQEVKKGDVLFWITDEVPLRVLFTVPESAMAAFSNGTLLTLTTPSYPGLHQPAKVLQVSPAVDPASGSIQVVGALAHPSPLLKPGMSMQIEASRESR